MVKTKKGDFIEIEFVARVKDGDIFDTNIKKEAEKAGLDIKNIKPYVLSVGNEMILKGLDKELEGKELGKEYNIELSPENAFGKRDSKLIKMIPLKHFIEQKIMPERGMQLNLDGQIVKVVSVSGGRVLVDFNNPLASKTLEYKTKIKRKVDDKKEQINALQEFLFRKTFDFDLKGKTLTLKVPEGMDKYVEMLGEQFKKILDLEVKSEVLASDKSKKSSEVESETKVVKEEKKN